MIDYSAVDGSPGRRFAQTNLNFKSLPQAIWGGLFLGRI
jgi:hypothetical protein